MNEVLFDIMLFVVIICTIAISRTIIPWIKSQIHESEYAETIDIVEKAVRKAEQVLHAPGQGKAKKAQVIAFVSNWLSEHSIHITEDQLDTLIEAAVFSMNNEG